VQIRIIGAKFSVMTCIGRESREEKYFLKEEAEISKIHMSVGHAADQ
jgi:hypothetical protein